MHESLIGEDEGRNTIEYNECYVVRQMLSGGNGLSEIDNGGRLCSEGFQYTSDNNPWKISIEELRTVIEQISDDYSNEYTIERVHFLKQDI